MRGHTTRFFGTVNDLKSIIEFVESRFEIQVYDVKSHFPGDKTFLSFNSLFDIPDLMISNNGNNSEKRFLIIPKDVALNIREIPRLYN